MTSSTVRISEEAKSVLQQLSARSGRKMQDVLGEAIESYRRRVFLEQANAAFAALRADAEAWTDEEEERAAWETALADGVEE